MHKKSNKFDFLHKILAYLKYLLYLCKRKGLIINDCTMEQKNFQQYSDAEFKAALLATMNLKQEWMASVDKRERELGFK